MKLCCALFSLASFAAHAHAEIVARSGMFGGLKVDYKVVLPNGYDPGRQYPAILAFGGGPQNMRIVDAALNRYWAPEAERRGYIVVSPAAPTDQLFFESSDRIFPEFLEMILHEYKVQGGRMHVAGSSSGGVSAFHVASLYPQYFWSVTVFPGYLDDTTDPVVEALRPLCIYMHVGDRDGDWGRAMKQQYDVFKARGYSAVLFVEEDQGHNLDLGPDDIAHFFEDLANSAKGCAK